MNDLVADHCCNAVTTHISALTHHHHIIITSSSSSSSHHLTSLLVYWYTTGRLTFISAGGPVLKILSKLMPMQCVKVLRVETKFCVKTLQELQNVALRTSHRLSMCQVVFTKGLRD